MFNIEIVLFLGALLSCVLARPAAELIVMKMGPPTIWHMVVPIFSLNLIGLIGVLVRVTHLSFVVPDADINRYDLGILALAVVLQVLAIRQVYLVAKVSELPDHKED